MVLAYLGGMSQLMSVIGQKINHIFSGGDPIVGEWFLVRETYLPFLLGACYVLFCTLIGPALMRNRKPFDLRGLMIVFNFCLVVLYVGGVITLLIYLPNATWEEFCIHGVVRKGDYSYTITCLAWSTYIIKYVEYIDTVLFILRKKTRQASFLHILHHTLVPFLGWVLLRTQTSFILCIPALLNGLVHIIMYSYYGLSAIGPQTQKYLWWKKYLTQLQMAQFVIIMVFVAFVEPLWGCPLIPTVHVMSITIGPLFLYLFYQFYKMTFLQKKD